MKILSRSNLSVVLFLFNLPVALIAQSTFPSGQLDPTRQISSPRLVTQGHVALPEQYIWIAGPRSDARPRTITPVYFRAAFPVNTVPQRATLYVAGAEASAAYINGVLVDTVQDNPASPLRMTVFETDISGKLQAGQNVLALKITPFAGRDRRIVVKIVPRSAGVDAPALLISGPAWKAASDAEAGWQDTGFKDASWKPVQTFGAIESSLEFLQGNEDAGLYRWPGYLGLSSFLVHATLPIKSVDQVFVGRSSYEHLDALTRPAVAGADKDFTVHLASAHVPEQQVPSLLLDFGREVSGRVEFVSDSDSPMQITVQYGESLEETLIQPYLGVDPITIQPHGTAYGPKSAFRYAKVRFVGGGPTLRFQSIALDDIYYPVEYRGSFESSDPLLNKIWEVGAYTAHLCMQDDLNEAAAAADACACC